MLGGLSKGQFDEGLRIREKATEPNGDGLWVFQVPPAKPLLLTESENNVCFY